MLEELLYFLQHQFPKYFKFLQTVPKKLDKSTKEKFKNALQILKNRLADDDSKLWVIAFQPYEDFINSENNSLNYANVAYLQALLNDLEVIPGSSLFKKDDAFLKNTLFKYNFNSWQFFYFLTEEIKANVQHEETLAGQLEKYYWHQKVINQTIIKPAVILFHERISIKDAVSDWLYEEIIFLEKKVQLLPLVNEQIKVGNNNFKVLTELSVSQYALFLRLINDNGIIKNKNTKELLRFYSQHTQTKKVLNVSPDSLYVKYYSVSDNDRQVVKSYIIKILNQLNNKLNILATLFFLLFQFGY